MLAERAHQEALSLEQKGSPEQLQPAIRRRLFELHALAAELIEYATAWPPPSFYGNIDGMTVSLHDLRAAQLAKVDPALLDDPNPAVVLRQETIRFYLKEMASKPGFADSAQVLALLRTPLEPPASLP